MNNSSDNWLKDELLQAFYNVIDDFKTGLIDDGTFKERLLRLAERYRRTFLDKEVKADQKDLF
ncbi:MAG: hypothetical protein AB1552_13880 [Nitrospirota bacterium]